MHAPTNPYTSCLSHQHRYLHAHPTKQEALGTSPRDIVTRFISLEFLDLTSLSDLQSVRRSTGDLTRLMFCKRCDGACHCYCQHLSHKNDTFESIQGVTAMDPISLEMVQVCSGSWDTLVVMLVGGCL